MMAINFWAVLVVAVISMILGSIWYGPLFGKTWGRIIGMDMQNTTPEDKKKMQKSVMPLYFLNFVLSVLTFYIFAHYVKGWQPAPGAHGGLINAFWIWL